MTASRPAKIGPLLTSFPYRQPGQGGSADNEVRDLRAELLKAEAAHFAKKNGKAVDDEDAAVSTSTQPKRALEDAMDEDDEEDAELKRRRLILEEARDIDADSDGDDSDSSDEE